MQKQHTPGPWFSRPCYSNGGEVHSASGIICDASIGLRERAEYQAAHRAESEANARLIAAAPDLLAKLKAAHAELINVACQPDDQLCNAQRARLSSLAREFGEVLCAAQPDQT